MIIKNSVPLLIAATLVLCNLSTNAQHMVASTEVEKNVAGIHYGASVSFENRKKFSLGAFYQCGISKVVADVTPVRPYYGLQAQLPLVTCEKMDVLLDARTGFVNKDFLVFVPALVTRVQLTRLLSFSIGSGFRMQNASVTGKINLTL
jgi:hypothetical protein